MKVCIECGDEFEHERHSFCFACKIQGITIGHVPNHDRPSKFAQEKNEIAAIEATGQEAVRITGNEKDRRETRKDYEVPRHLKKYFADDDNKMVDPLKQHQVTHDDSAAQREMLTKVVADRV